MQPIQFLGPLYRHGVITPDFLNTIEDIGLRAAVIVREMLQTNYNISEKSSSDDLVTDIDHAINNFLGKHLMRLTPDWGWVSEESKDNAMKKFSWVIDPIDGTSSMIRNEEFAISIAIVKKGTPILGVVINPTEYTMVSGAIGLGLRLNKQEFNTYHAKKNLRILLSHAQVRKNIIDTDLELLPMGSIAWRLANIAIGKGEITLGWYPESAIWDVAAGHALLLAIGGILTDKDGKPIDYTSPTSTFDGLVASRSSTYHGLAKSIQRSRNNVN